MNSVVTKDNVKSRKTIQRTFELYHEFPVFKQDKIIRDIKRFLDESAPDYRIRQIGVVPDDTRELLNLNDDEFFVMSVTAVLNCAKNFLDTKDIVDIIQWYLETYQPWYTLIKS